MKEVIKSSGMSLKEFAEYYEIPYNTVRQWYNEEREAPKYIKKLIEENLKLKTKGQQITIEEIDVQKTKNNNWKTPNYILQWKIGEGEYMYGYTTFKDVIKVIKTFNDKTEWRILDIKYELHKIMSADKINIDKIKKS